MQTRTSRPAGTTCSAKTLRDVLAFLSAPKGDGLTITGPTGSGKTSLVEQAAARINWPVQTITGHGRLELNDLLGQWLLLKGGGMRGRRPVDATLTPSQRVRPAGQRDRRDGAFQTGGPSIMDASHCQSRRPAKPSGRTTSSGWSLPATAPVAATAAACTKACCGRTWPCWTGSA